LCETVGARFGAFPLKLHPAWAEDRAMLGSNPSADSGPKTDARCLNHTPFRILIALGTGTKAIHPRRLGAGPQIHYPLNSRNSPNINVVFIDRIR
jgi:hypothetical protein